MCPYGATFIAKYLIKNVCLHSINVTIFLQMDDDSKFSAMYLTWQVS